MFDNSINLGSTYQELSKLKMCKTFCDILDSFLYKKTSSCNKWIVIQLCRVYEQMTKTKN